MEYILIKFAFNKFKKKCKKKVNEKGNIVDIV